MTRYKLMLIKKSGSLETGLRMLKLAKVQHFESMRKATTFDDLYTGQPMREIASLTWNPAKKRYRLWMFKGHTHSDFAASAFAAARHALKGGPDLSCEAWTPEKGRNAYSLWFCRSLSDYGDDLMLVAQVPNTVPAELVSEVRSS